MWLGTSRGVFRFDGKQIREIELPDSLKRKECMSMCIHGAEILIGLENGTLLRIDAKKKTLAAIKNVSTTGITSIFADDKHRIWIGTSGEGLFVLNGQEISQFNTQQGLADSYIHDITGLHNHIAVATDLGLSLCRYDYNELKIRNYSVADGLTDNLIISLCKNGTENLVLGMQNGSICNLNITNNRIDPFPAFNEANQSSVIKILPLLENLLVITESSDAYILNWADLLRIQKFQLEPGLKIKNLPRDAMVDQEGNLVVTFGTEKIYLTDFRLQFIRDHDETSFSNAFAVLGDRSGNIWFSNEKGIFRHAGDFTSSQFVEHIYKAPAEQNDIVALCEDHNHNIWFGTFGNGVGYINLVSGQTRIFTEKDGLVNNNVLSIAVQNETLWLATLGGACTINITDGGPVFSAFDTNSALASKYIYCVFVDPENQVWFGTDGKGLVKNDHGSFRFLIDELTGMGKSVTSIAQDNSGRIWYVTTDHGIQYIDASGVHDYQIPGQDEHLNVFSISTDAFGNIVALIPSGLALIQTETLRTTILRTGFEVSTEYLNTASLDAQGRMWLASNEALIRYSDYNIGRKLKPKTLIESVEVMLVPIDSSMHQYGYDDHHVAFNVTSIWFQDPSSVLFQYKLIGYDIDWVTTRDNKILFSQLRPGDYTFLVRSSVDEDWENALAESYSFTIKRPWWKTTWFSIALLGLAALVSFTIARIRFNNIRKKEMIAREKVQSQFDTLRNQVNPHFLFNSFNTLSSIIQQDQNAATTYVEKLSDYFRIVLEQREKDVITVKEELDLVQNYLYLQKQRFGENLQIETELSAATLNSLIPPMSIQLLTENAIKHNVISKSRPLKIRIYEKDQKIIVANNLQLKLTKEPSTGIGLDNIRNRYLLLFKKQIEQEEMGSTFEIRLPIITKLN